MSAAIAQARRMQFKDEYIVGNVSCAQLQKNVSHVQDTLEWIVRSTVLIEGLQLLERQFKGAICTS